MWVTGGFPLQRASNANFGVFFVVCKWLRKLLPMSCRWFKMPWRSWDVKVMFTILLLMMTSSNGNIFRVTDSLWGESTDDRRIPLAELWFFIYAWTNGWAKSRDAGDLRRHRAHYDVTGMCKFVWYNLYCNNVVPEVYEGLVNNRDRWHRGH